MPVIIMIVVVIYALPSLSNYDGNAFSVKCLCSINCKSILAMLLRCFSPTISKYMLLVNEIWMMIWVRECNFTQLFSNKCICSTYKSNVIYSGVFSYSCSWIIYLSAIKIAQCWKLSPSYSWVCFIMIESPWRRYLLLPYNVLHLLLSHFLKYSWVLN